MLERLTLDTDLATKTVRFDTPLRLRIQAVNNQALKPPEKHAPN